LSAEERAVLGYHIVVLVFKHLMALVFQCPVETVNAVCPIPGRITFWDRGTGSRPFQQSGI
jgi:hypothetical protein